MINVGMMLTGTKELDGWRKMWEVVDVDVRWGRRRKKVEECGRGGVYDRANSSGSNGGGQCFDAASEAQLG